MATLIKHSVFTINLCESKKAKLTKFYDYAKFLTQPIQLGHFVPCDDSGNVLKEPLHIELYEGSTYDIDCKIYKEAQLRLVFKGFTFKDNGGWITLLYEEKYFKSFANFNDVFRKETIEDFLPFNLEVSDWVQEKFNL